MHIYDSTKNKTILVHILSLLKCEVKGVYQTNKGFMQIRYLSMWENSVSLAEINIIYNNKIKILFLLLIKLHFLIE